MTIDSKEIKLIFRPAASNHPAPSKNCIMPTTRMNNNNNKEPQGLSRSDGKRPDGLTLIPWQAGKAVTWDVTVVCPLADTYIHTAAQDAGAVAELAAARKTARYAALESRYIFSQLRWKHSARLMVQLFRFSVVLVDGLPRFQVNLVKAAFFSSG